MAAPVSQPVVPFPGAAFDIVVLAASAGGLRALSEVVSGLPAAFPAAVLAVLHLAPQYPSRLAPIFSRRTALRVEQPVSGGRVRPGRLYLAPPDWHLLLTPGRRLQLAQTPPVHHLRPAADLLFQSAAACCRERVLGVVLSGTGSDGKAGVAAIKESGGMVLAEDPATAEFAGMPRAAVDTGCVDWVVTLSDIGATLLRLVSAAPT